MKPKVMWWNSRGRGSWACVNVLNEMFDLYECEHFPAKVVEGLVTVFHGGNYQAKDAAETLNSWGKNFKWIILISIGDEAAEFPVHLLSHPNMRLWVQTPLPTTKANRYLIEGYPAGTKRADVERDLDWSFAGQVTHERRFACMDALQKCDGKGSIMETHAFGTGLPQDEYCHLLSRTKVVPCPSGPASPDTFRIWESLECGAIPILDSRSLRPETVGFWRLVLGDDCPLPVIEDWSRLPQVMETILGDYERIQRLTAYWWKAYKIQFRNWLAQDLLALGAK